jgi:hypothetical protein
MMKPARIFNDILISILCALLFLLGTSQAQGEKVFPDLFERFDEDLQQRLKKILADQHLTGAVKRENLSVALVDITDLKRPKVAALRVW